MDDLISQLTSTLRAMWLRRWIGLAVAWLLAPIGAVAILLVPNKYEASARIYVDTQSILKPLMTGLTVQPNVEQQIVMLSRTLISRPNVEKLIRMADLDLNGGTKEAREALVDELMRSVEIKGTGRDNLYTIAYRNSDPEKAKRVVQSLVSIFVESSLGKNRRDSDSARKFIDDQIKTYEKKLESAESRLKEFKLRNLEMQAADGKSGADRLSDINGELANARLALREAENSRDAIKRQIAGEEPVLTGGDKAGVPVPEIDSRIGAQQRNLDTLLQRFTEQHPDVVSTRRLIKELEEQKQREIDERGTGATTGPAAAFSNNPVYQHLKMTLAEAEANVASRSARVDEYQARYERMKQLMRISPQIEAEFAQLNRDYDINKKNYEALVARRESASLSGDLDSVAGVADFRLIDPPRVAPKPVAPNRLLLLPLPLLLSLGAGVFSTFVASQLRPVFLDSASLQLATGLPMLGSVLLVESDSAKRQHRKELKRFFIGFVALLLAFGAGSVVLGAMS